MLRHITTASIKQTHTSNPPPCDYEHGDRSAITLTSHDWDTPLSIAVAHITAIKNKGEFSRRLDSYVKETQNGR